MSNSKFIDVKKFIEFIESKENVYNCLIGGVLHHNRLGKGYLRGINQSTKSFIVDFAGYRKRMLDFEELYQGSIYGILLSEDAVKDIYSAYKSVIENKRINDGINKIKKALDEYDYETAETEYHLIQSKYPKNLYNKLVTSAKQAQIRAEQEKITRETLNKIELRMKLYDFDAAEELYQDKKAFCPKLSYLNLVEKYKKKRLEEELNQLLTVSNFIQADKLNDSEKLFSMDEYKNIKAPYVKDFVKNKYEININTEKANALSLPHQNTLITARAGSGKTLLLALKAALLIDCYGYHPDQLMVMAFNRKARGEIGDRIRKRLSHPGFLNARTFHSLAYRLINPKQDILFDENQYSVNAQKLSGFIQRIVKEKIKNPVFMNKLYEHFRAETKELKRERFHLSDEEYLAYRRNLTYVTLDGLNVKSSGEKIIADFLFEHGISYYYEDSKYWGKEIYRPDFSLYENQQDFIIEFWGIDESDTDKQVPDDWTVTWYEYYQEIQSKRKYCQTNEIKLIEFSIADLKHGREEFEKIISRKLRSNGITFEKLSHDELIKKVKENDRIITRITNLFTQFIQKAKKKMWSGSEVQRRLKTYSPAEEIEEIFLDLAVRVYLEYEDLLIKENKIDFDEMMREAIDLIHKSKGNCTISFGHNKSHRLSMNDLKWILIDEYQDFSEEFFNLIDAIRKYNTEVRLFCVGDNWQAINGFAGSDLKFFNNFSEYIWPVFTENLVTNFRSQQEIIHWGNALMKDLGEPSKHLPENQYGKVYLDNMDDVWIEQRNGDQFQNQKNEDEKFKISTPSLNKQNTNYYKITATKYLKLCHKIITNSDDGEKTMAILSRRNRIDGIPLSHFRNKLIDCLVEETDQDKKSLKDRINIGTVHKYKGLEEDVVIILQACNRSFPLIHPDNSLFYFFGDTPQEVIAEEKRLFYVAISRPKSELYLLGEKNLESDYIDQTLNNDPDLSYSSILNQGINEFNNINIAEDEIPF